QPHVAYHQHRVNCTVVRVRHTHRYQILGMVLASLPMSGRRESAHVRRTQSVHYQHCEAAKATHYVLHTNSEVDETSDLIHSIFPQTFGLLSAVIESPDEAQWTRSEERRVGKECRDR